MGPCGPEGPVGPCGPGGPCSPSVPFRPCGPEGPVGPCGPGGPCSPSVPFRPCGPEGPVGLVVRRVLWGLVVQVAPALHQYHCVLAVHLCPAVQGCSVLRLHWHDRYWTLLPLL